MIDFQHEKDKRRFLKRNLQVSKPCEIDMEKQRVEQGKVHQFRSVLIDKVCKPNFMPKRD